MELLSPSITDEWGALRSAIVYPQLNYNLRCHSDHHPNLGEVGLSDLLRYHDVELVVPDMPESVACMRMFARDPITVIGRHVHGCLMRNIRNNEGQYSIDCLQSRGVLPIPWHTHGGDVLVLDATSVLVGYGPTRADNSEPWEEADESEAAHITKVSCTQSQLNDSGSSLANAYAVWHVTKNLNSIYSGSIPKQ
jgi:hypothetical protein